MASRKAQDTPRTPHPSHPARDCTNLHQNTAGTLSANRAELRDTSKQSRSQHLHLRFRDVGAVGSSPVTSTSKPRRYGVSAFDEMPYLLFVTLRTLLRTLFPFFKIGRTTLSDRPAFLVHTLRALCRHINILPLVRLQHIGEHIRRLHIGLG